MKMAVGLVSSGRLKATFDRHKPCRIWKIIIIDYYNGDIRIVSLELQRCIYEYILLQ